MNTKVKIRCLCDKEITLVIVGGQYQNTYQGDCDCGRKWSLEEQSEAMEELEK